MMLSRRRLLTGTTSLVGALSCTSLFPAWADSRVPAVGKGQRVLSGETFDLEIARHHIFIDGRRGDAVTINGQVPGPVLRWREGGHVTLNVTNRLDEPTSIHWHGILLPFQMDGVPGVTFPGIRPGETFTYRFPVKQAGTYWYHSHSGLQEQSGHYGAIVIEPAEADPVLFDREHVIVLSDWTFSHPHRVFAKLKKSSESYNYQQRTLGDFFKAARDKGFKAVLKDRAAWGAMRMSPTDISDVTGATYRFLVNGHGPEDNWTALFTPGERVRFRFINAAAMTIFNVRVPGLPMTVVQSDGLDVKPVVIDEFQVGPAETYDVILQPTEDRAYTLMCESIDRSGYGRGTLSPRVGMDAEIPPMRLRPILTMKDMGMSHSMEGGTMMDHSAMGHDSGGNMEGQDHPHAKGPGVANTAMNPTNRLREPGAGLENEPHRVLRYTDLRSLEPNPDTRAPEREIELHLTSNMERYMWSFDGVKFSDVNSPIVFYKDERVRMTMVNDSMMPHPIHLHGMFFDVVNGETTHKPRKHTIIVKPGEKLSVDITADALGDWALHCHLIYHMHAGMMRVVSVRERGEGSRT